MVHVVLIDISNSNISNLHIVKEDWPALETIDVRDNLKTYCPTVSFLRSIIDKVLSDCPNNHSIWSTTSGAHYQQREPNISIGLDLSKSYERNSTYNMEIIFFDIISMIVLVTIIGCINMIKLKTKRTPNEYSMTKINDLNTSRELNC